jgi:outer membrane immunogenic protein
MRRILLASIAIAVFAAATTTATGADLLTRPAPVQVPTYASPYYNWTGLYLGINGGGGWGASELRGGLVGGTAGFNWQFGPWVFGLEGDADWSSVNNGTGCPAAICDVSNNWLSTVRGRVGYSVERLLPYVTAGAAIGDIKVTTPGFSGVDATNLGWTVGGGIEFAFAGPWSAKIEYLYVDLGDTNCGAACGLTVPGHVNLWENVVRAGVNYKF